MSKGVVRAEEARRELARRELARRHVVDFSEYMAPWYKAARNHRLVAGVLEEVERYVRTEGAEGIGRVLIFEPPRHGKSQQASRFFPAWLLGRLPNSRVILTSYGADLANRNSKAVRDLVMDVRYQAVFGDKAARGGEAPVMVASDSRSVEAWDLATPHRGGVKAAGVGGAITGLGANLLIVDDPFKNREEAESEAQRDRVWDWWMSAAYTRLEKGGAVIGMLTRWHVDDWAGRLIRAMASNEAAERYQVISLPALWEAPIVPKGKGWEEYRRERMLEGIWVEQEDLLGREPGEALWPEKYSTEDLGVFRKNMDAYNFEALYQQQPVLRAGNYFKREWFVVVDEVPFDKVPFDRLKARVRYWDKAGTEGDGDYTVGVLMSLDVQGYFYVEHVVRGQWSPSQRDEVMLRTAKQDRERPGPTTTIWHQQDPGSAGLESAQATNRLLTGYGVHFELVSGSKESRADPLASQCEVGRVRLVRGGWNEGFIEELCGFPRGRHDDQVDGASGAFSKLAGGKDGWLDWAKKKLEPQITQIDADGKEVSSEKLAVGSGEWAVGSGMVEEG